MKGISGKVIWVTGASSGIGEALALALAKIEGTRLILSSRNLANLENLKAQISRPEDVKLLPLDLEAPSSLEQVAAHAIRLFGQVDILINNAGISQRSLIADTRMEVYRTLMEVNYFGTIALTKALLPHFVSRRQGHFVTVTSLMGIFGSPLRSGYCAAKHALHGFFDVLRQEHEKDGIRVTLICPGFVATNVAKNALIADGRMQKSDDQATAAGMHPDIFAGKMLKAVSRGRHEAYIGGREVAGVYLKRFIPKLLHKVILRSRVV
jgi:dehydrogenase/reductase SDR family protein 7